MELISMNHVLTRLGVLSAHPAAFAILLVYTVLWIVFEPSTFDWHAVATLCTWFMTLLIQRAEHRDTQAIHAKLDELLHIHGEARNALTRMDEREPEDIERFRSQQRRGD
jgi:low affinity Fe/Cu permease